MNIAVIGAGVVGSALAALLSGKGYNITGVYSKTKTSAERVVSHTGGRVYPTPWEALSGAELIFITTPDGEIGKTVKEIALNNGFKEGQVVAHTSGALSSDILKPAKDFGAKVLSIHPLQSFADIDGAISNLPGSFFALEGDEEALPLAEDIVKLLEGISFRIKPEDKILYHTGAVAVSNYLVSLVHYAVSLYELIGINREVALKALLPLIRGTINNIRKNGPAKALTGPIARGDHMTVKKHLDSLINLEKKYYDLYRSLGNYTVDVAHEKGTINKEKGKILKTLFQKE